jgi:hypothetical protein
MTRIKKEEEERREQRIRKYLSRRTKVYLVFDSGACNVHRGKIHSKVSKVDK